MVKRAVFTLFGKYGAIEMTVIIIIITLIIIFILRLLTRQSIWYVKSYIHLHDDL